MRLILVDFLKKGVLPSYLLLHKSIDKNAGEIGKNASKIGQIFRLHYPKIKSDMETRFG
jgi:hypothetical protein